MSRLYQRSSLSKFWGFLGAILLNMRFALAAANRPEDLGELFEIIYKVLLPISIILGLFLIVLNGYGILTSEGDPRKVQTAKENLTSAILGLVFVLCALAIYRVVVTSFFDVSFP